MPLISIAINQNEYRRLVFVIDSTSTCGQATRARRTVALATLLASGNAHLVDLDWYNEVESGHVQRSYEALDLYQQSPTDERTVILPIPTGSPIKPQK